MTQQHPITPPPELVRHWSRFQGDTDPEALWFRIANEAAQWGADQELEACCQWISDDAEALRIYRRPKPPSLKEQALEALMTADGPDHPTPMLYLRPDAASIIRRALEQLPDD